MTLHPQRCETCDDHTCRYAPVNGDYKTSTKKGAWKCTAEKGCASHSSQQSEREKVLDEAIHAIRYCSQRGLCIQMLEELRQGKDGEP